MSRVTQGGVARIDSVAQCEKQILQVFQEEEPGGLLGVVEFGGAAGLFRRTSSMFLKACSNMGTWNLGMIGRKTVQWRVVLSPAVKVMSSI